MLWNAAEKPKSFFSGFHQAPNRGNSCHRPPFARQPVACIYASVPRAPTVAVVGVAVAVAVAVGVGVVVVVVVVYSSSSAVSNNMSTHSTTPQGEGAYCDLFLFFYTTPAQSKPNLTPHHPTPQGGGGHDHGGEGGLGKLVHIFKFV